MIHGLLLSGAVRAAIVLTLGLAAYALVARAAAATRRFVLVLTLGAAVVVPVAAAMGPRWTVEAPAALAVFAHESANESAVAGEPARESTDVAWAASPRAAASSTLALLDATDAIVLAWVVIAAALLARACASHLRAHGLVRRATPVAKAPWIEAAKDAAAERAVDVRASSEIDSPAVTGLLRATIVIPNAALDWPIERCRLVLVHELAHVRQRDVLVQALADVACAPIWSPGCNEPPVTLRGSRVAGPLDPGERYDFLLSARRSRMHACC